MKHIKPFNEAAVNDSDAIKDIMNIAKDDPSIDFYCYKAKYVNKYNMRATLPIPLEGDWITNPSIISNVKNLVDVCRDIHNRLTNEDIEHKVMVITNELNTMSEIETPMDEYDHEAMCKKNPRHFVWDIIINISDFSMYTGGVSKE